MKIERDFNHARGNHLFRARKFDFVGLIPEDISWGEDLRIVLQFLVKIETPVKLNIIDSEGVSLID